MKRVFCKNFNFCNYFGNLQKGSIEELSKSDADALKQALNIKTIRDLAENRFVSELKARTKTL